MGRVERNAAFTLIEVLVVVAIIALLVTILLPSLSLARDQAKSVRCMTNMRDMSTGVRTFAAAHAGRFQLVTNDTGVTDVTRDGDRDLYEYQMMPRQLFIWPIIILREAGVRGLKRNLDWGHYNQQMVALYARQGKIRRFEQLVCPSDKIEFGSPFWPLAGAGTSDQGYYGYLSYGINEDVAGARTDTSKFTNPNEPPVWKDGNKGGGLGGGERLRGILDNVVRPSEVVFFSDAGSDQPIGSMPAATNLLITRLSHGPYLEYFETTWARLPYRRHRGGSLNITYADGHGGFAKRVKKPTAISGIEPDFAYVPRSRISPYNPGRCPVP
jgi:prepilin-type N-terminal cleavage/methylation domain-containing protein/prepilin-type processing-associated H-X9-DG protein